MSTITPCFGGDLWSNSDFALASPLKELLDGGEFTLEQILREDELLQEVKSMHPQLIDFLAQSTSIATLIEYLVRVDSNSSSSSSSSSFTKKYISMSAEYEEEDGIEYQSSMDTQEDLQQQQQPPPLQNEKAQVKMDDNIFCYDGNNTNDNGGSNPSEIATNVSEITEGAEPSLPQEEEEEEAKDGNHLACSRRENNCNKSLLANATDYDDSPFMFIEDDSTNGNNNNKSMDNEEKDDEEYRTLRRVRYPYMACEIVCCENPRILDMLVYGRNEQQGITLLDQFFSILELSPDNLDDRHAGYFEKIVTVLLRIRTKPLIDYINRRGLELFEKFVTHLHNYAIMSVLDRLLLPSPLIADGDYTTAKASDSAGSSTESSDVPMDSSSGDGGVNNATTETSVISLCNWGDNVEIISLLVDKLIEDNSPDGVVATHSSELLVSRVQHAPLASPILQLLSSGTVLKKIIHKASVLGEGSEVEFTSHDTGMTRALLLLESIVLQLGGYGCVPPVDTSLSLSFTYPSSIPPSIPSSHIPDNSSTLDLMENNHPEIMDSKPNLTLANSNDLITLLPDCLAKWDALLTHEITKSWQVMNQMGQVIPMVGVSRLRIVRLIEALVLLAHPIVDRQLVKANSIRHCLDLFFEFEWCSMLHQSVANLVVHVLERDGWRAPLQSYLVNDLQLLERLISAYEKNSKSCVHTNENDVVVFRLGFIGHVIIICQAIAHACAQKLKRNNDVAADTEIEESEQNGIHLSPATEYTEITPLASIISQSSCGQRWNEFVSSTLAAITAVQATPLGGSLPPSRAAAEMQNQEEDALIQMNESELDIAATMIESMNIPCEEEEDEDEDGRRRKKQGGLFSDFADFDQTREYCYDDPLGRTDKIDEEMDSNNKDVSVSEDDDDADAPVLDLFAGNFGSSSFFSKPENTKTNGDLSFFADFDNHYQRQDDTSPTFEEFAAFDHSTFDQGDENFTANSTPFIQEWKDENFQPQSSEGKGEEIEDPFGTTKFNIDDIF